MLLALDSSSGTALVACAPCGRSLKNEPQAKLSLARTAKPVCSRSKRRNSGGTVGVEQSGERIHCCRRLAENAVAIATESFVGCACLVVSADRKHEARTPARPELIQQSHVHL